MLFFFALRIFFGLLLSFSGRCETLLGSCFDNVNTDVVTASPTELSAGVQYNGCSFSSGIRIISAAVPLTEGSLTIRNCTIWNGIHFNTSISSSDKGPIKVIIHDTNITSGETTNPPPSGTSDDVESFIFRGAVDGIVLELYNVRMFVESIKASGNQFKMLFFAQTLNQASINVSASNFISIGEHGGEMIAFNGSIRNSNVTIGSNCSFSQNVRSNSVRTGQVIGLKNGGNNLSISIKETQAIFNSISWADATLGVIWIEGDVAQIQLTLVAVNTSFQAVRTAFMVASPSAKTSASSYTAFNVKIDKSNLTFVDVTGYYVMYTTSNITEGSLEMIGGQVQAFGVATESSHLFEVYGATKNVSMILKNMNVKQVEAPSASIYLLALLGWECQDVTMQVIDSVVDFASEKMLIYIARVHPLEASSVRSVNKLSVQFIGSTITAVALNGSSPWIGVIIPAGNSSHIELVSRRSQVSAVGGNILVDMTEKKYDPVGIFSVYPIILRSVSNVTLLVEDFSNVSVVSSGPRELYAASLYEGVNNGSIIIRGNSVVQGIQYGKNHSLVATIHMQDSLSKFDYGPYELVVEENSTVSAIAENYTEGAAPGSTPVFTASALCVFGFSQQMVAIKVNSSTVNAVGEGPRMLSMVNPNGTISVRVMNSTLQLKRNSTRPVREAIQMLFFTSSSFATTTSIGISFEGSSISFSGTGASAFFSLSFFLQNLRFSARKSKISLGVDGGAATMFSMDRLNLAAIEMSDTTVSFTIKQAFGATEKSLFVEGNEVQNFTFFGRNLQLLFDVVLPLDVFRLQSPRNVILSLSESSSLSIPNNTQPSNPTVKVFMLDSNTNDCDSYLCYPIHNVSVYLQRNTRVIVARGGSAFLYFFQVQAYFLWSTTSVTFEMTGGSEIILNVSFDSLVTSAALFDFRGNINSSRMIIDNSALHVNVEPTVSLTVPLSLIRFSPEFTSDFTSDFTIRFANSSKISYRLSGVSAFTSINFVLFAGESYHNRLEVDDNVSIDLLVSGATGAASGQLNAFLVRANEVLNTTLYVVNNCHFQFQAATLYAFDLYSTVINDSSLVIQGPGTTFDTSAGSCTFFSTILSHSVLRLSFQSKDIRFNGVCSSSAQFLKLGDNKSQELDVTVNGLLLNFSTRGPVTVMTFGTTTGEFQRSCNNTAIRVANSTFIITVQPMLFSGSGYSVSLLAAKGSALAFFSNISFQMLASTVTITTPGEVAVLTLTDYTGSSNNLLFAAVQQSSLLLEACNLTVASTKGINSVSSTLCSRSCQDNNIVVRDSFLDLQTSSTLFFASLSLPRNMSVIVENTTINGYGSYVRILSTLDVDIPALGSVTLKSTTNTKMNLFGVYVFVGVVQQQNLLNSHVALQDTKLNVIDNGVPPYTNTSLVVVLYVKSPGADCSLTVQRVQLLGNATYQMPTRDFKTGINFIVTEDWACCNGNLLIEDVYMKWRTKSILKLSTMAASAQWQGLTVVVARVEVDLVLYGAKDVNQFAFNKTVNTTLNVSDLKISLLLLPNSGQSSQPEDDAWNVTTVHVLNSAGRLSTQEKMRNVSVSVNVLQRPDTPRIQGGNNYGVVSIGSSTELSNVNRKYEHFKVQVNALHPMFVLVQGTESSMNATTVVDNIDMTISTPSPCVIFSQLTEFENRAGHNISMANSKIVVSFGTNPTFSSALFATENKRLGIIFFGVNTLQEASFPSWKIVSSSILLTLNETSSDIQAIHYVIGFFGGRVVSGDGIFENSSLKLDVTRPTSAGAFSVLGTKNIIGILLPQSEGVTDGYNIAVRNSNISIEATNATDIAVLQQQGLVGYRNVDMILEDSSVSVAIGTNAVSTGVQILGIKVLKRASDPMVIQNASFIVRDSSISVNATRAEIFAMTTPDITQQPSNNLTVTCEGSDITVSASVQADIGASSLGYTGPAGNPLVGSGFKLNISKNKFIISPETPARNCFLMSERTVPFSIGDLTMPSTLTVETNQFFNCFNTSFPRDESGPVGGGSLESYFTTATVACNKIDGLRARSVELATFPGANITLCTETSSPTRSWPTHSSSRTRGTFTSTVTLSPTLSRMPTPSASSTPTSTGSFSPTLANTITEELTLTQDQSASQTVTGTWTEKMTESAVSSPTVSVQSSSTESLSESATWHKLRMRVVAVQGVEPPNPPYASHIDAMPGPQLTIPFSSLENSDRGTRRISVAILEGDDWFQIPNETTVQPDENFYVPPVPDCSITFPIILRQVDVERMKPATFLSSAVEQTILNQDWSDVAGNGLLAWSNRSQVREIFLPGSNGTVLNLVLPEMLPNETSLGGPPYGTVIGVNLTVLFSPYCFAKRSTLPHLNQSFGADFSVLPDPPVKRQVVPQSVLVTAAVGAALSGSVGTPVGAMTLARVNLIANLVDCDMEMDEPLGHSSSITNLPIGTERTRYFIGAAVLNTVMFGIFVCLHLGIALHRLHCVKQVSSWNEALVWARFPSIEAFPLMFFLQPTISSAFTAFMFSDGISIRMVVLLIGVFYIALLIQAYRHIFLNRTFCFVWANPKEQKEALEKMYSPTEPHNASTSKSQLKIRKFFDGLFQSAGEWTDINEETPVLESAVRKYLLFFVDYTDRAPWFLLVEACVAVVLATVGSLGTDGLWPCHLVAIIILVVLVVYLVGMTALRPHESKFNFCFTAKMALLETVATALALLHLQWPRPSLEFAIQFLLSWTLSCVSLRGAYDIFRVLWNLARSRAKRLREQARRLQFHFGHVLSPRKLPIVASKEVRLLEAFGPPDEELQSTKIEGDKARVEFEVEKLFPSQKNMGKFRSFVREQAKRNKELSLTLTLATEHEKRLQLAIDEINEI